MILGIIFWLGQMGKDQEDYQQIEAKGYFLEIQFLCILISTYGNSFGWEQFKCELKNIVLNFRYWVVVIYGLDLMNLFYVFFVRI